MHGHSFPVGLVTAAEFPPFGCVPFVVGYFPDLFCIVAVWYLQVFVWLGFSNSLVWLTFQNVFGQILLTTQVSQHPADLWEPTGHQHLCVLLVFSSQESRESLWNEHVCFWLDSSFWMDTYLLVLSLFPKISKMVWNEIFSWKASISVVAITSGSDKRTRLKDVKTFTLSETSKQFFFRPPPQNAVGFAERDSRKKKLHAKISEHFWVSFGIRDYKK